MTAYRNTPNVSGEINRLRVFIRGAVQGVGFRPFIFKLATEMELKGWVSNSPQGVTIEAEGLADALRTFILRIEKDLPPRASIQSMEYSYLDSAGYNKFEILASSMDGIKSALILPDISTCPDCLAEVFDPENRRYLYPFTNCTNCGPRYSIIEALPYDRSNTTMRRFEMCHDCRLEYEDPHDRRFHAQPNACPTCGPLIELWDGNGNCISDGNEALLAAVEGIREGKIVAVKGLGGFHLMADARSDRAIAALRERKHREEKPLALMVPSGSAAAEICEISEIEMRSLTSPERPIVILKARHLPGTISVLVAPGNPYLGCMLPYTPLHHLLIRELATPVVATSGNLSDEPICIDEREAVERLHGIADLFLVHDRPIARHVDDSVVRIISGREMVIRRARGFAPLPIPLPDGQTPLLAVGAHLKNSIVVAANGRAFVSQHIGDLETPQAYTAFTDTIESLEELYDIKPSAIACDVHPDYMSTHYARGTGILRVPIQHHYAHILSCMAENEIVAPALGVAWDGTGLGDDGTIWGGEFLKINDTGYERVAHLRTFPLPGGDKASREPRRSAIGVLSEELGDHIFMMDDLEPVKAFSPAEVQLVKEMLARRVNSPLTSSAGRLFDAVASIIGLRHISKFEGQAAMELEFAIGAIDTDERYEIELRTISGEPAILDWGRMVEDVVNDFEYGDCRALIAARFHNSMVDAIVRAAEFAGLPSVVLSGGCFQNKYLLEHAIRRLQQTGFRPYWHQRVPTNDGGIALGQAFGAVRAIEVAEAVASENTRRHAALCV